MGGLRSGQATGGLSPPQERSIFLFFPPSPPAFLHRNVRRSLAATAHAAKLLSLSQRLGCVLGNRRYSRRNQGLGALHCAHDSRIHTARISFRIRHFLWTPDIASA